MRSAIPAAVASVLAVALRENPLRSPRRLRIVAKARDRTGSARAGVTVTDGRCVSRTNSITRRLDAGSTTTGSRNSSMSDASGSGAGMRSNTIHPLKDLTQSFARPLHAHLERRNSRTGHGGHLFVAQSFDVMEQERFALVRPDLGECSRNLLAQRSPLGRVRLCGFRDRVIDLVREH